MAHKSDIGKYIAERLVYFKKGYEDLGKSDPNDFIKASKNGNIIISRLEFKIKTFDKNFVIDITPVEKIDWNRLKTHFQNLEDFWGQDKKLEEEKKHMDELSKFVINKKEMILDDEKIKIKGVFYNYNDSAAYKYVLNCVVKPLLFYGNALR